MSKAKTNTVIVLMFGKHFDGAAKQRPNKALHPTAYSFARSSLRFRRRVSLVVLLPRAALLEPQGTFERYLKNDENTSYSS